LSSRRPARTGKALDPGPDVQAPRQACVPEHPEFRAWRMPDRAPEAGVGHSGDRH
jgi:hypothetical protein